MSSSNSQCCDCPLCHIDRLRHLLWRIQPILNAGSEIAFKVEREIGSVHTNAIRMQKPSSTDKFCIREGCPDPYCNLPADHEGDHDDTPRSADETTAHPYSRTTDAALAAFFERWKKNPESAADQQWVNGYARALQHVRSNSVPAVEKNGNQASAAPSDAGHHAPIGEVEFAEYPPRLSEETSLTQSSMMVDKVSPATGDERLAEGADAQIASAPFKVGDRVVSKDGQPSNVATITDLTARGFKYTYDEPVTFHPLVGRFIGGETYKPDGWRLAQNGTLSLKGNER